MLMDSEHHLENKEVLAAVISGHTIDVSKTVEMEEFTKARQ